MQEVKFTLRTLTPLFLAGADQTKAELRAPTFRGLMRYWQRALVGGLVGTDKKGLDKVVEYESNVFGTTDKGSAVGIKVSIASREPEAFTEQTGIPLGGGKYKATGKGYLLWSMKQSGRVDRENFKPTRLYFPQSTQFHVTLSTRSQDSTAFKQAVSAFWLLIQLGGIGSRSRRCAGSLAVEQVELINNETELPDLSFNAPANMQELKKQIENGITKTRTLYKPLQHFTGDPQFDVLEQGACRIWILQDDKHQPWRKAEEAMSAIGDSLQTYRSTIQPLWRRQIFGLPLRDVSSARRASPLLLRVVKLQGEQYVGIVVLFKTKVKGVSMNDYTIIERWITQHFPTALEVNL